MYTRIQIISEMYVTIQITDIYENTITSVVAYLTENYHFKVIVMIQ